VIKEVLSKDGLKKLKGTDRDNNEVNYQIKVLEVHRGNSVRFAVA
jgi:hypothetical protein